MPSIIRKEPGGRLPMTTSQLFHRDLNATYPVIARGEGIYLYDEEGKRYIDGIAGASNVTLGHGNRRIAAAMAEQAQTLAYCFSSNFTNRPALELARRIGSFAPGDLNSVYFVSGGSEANESALKVACQYQQQRGNPRKHLAIARWRSYHGSTLGAMALSGIPSQRQAFAQWLPAFPHISSCYPYRCQFAGCDGRCNLTCADELERAILEAGPQNVAVFFAEPIALGSVAGSIPPPDYFGRIREICDRHDVLFVADEIITGFGRTGRYFAIDHWDTVPDMISFGKGASSGYMPLGGVVVSDHIRQSFADSRSQLAHIFTYVDNPVAARVGLTVLDILEEEGILAHVIDVAGHLHEKAQDLDKHRIVGDVRTKGLIMGVELVADKATKQPFPATASVHTRLNSILLDRGLALGHGGAGADSVDGDDIRLYPPLISTREQIDEILGIIDAGISQLESEL